MSKEQRQPETQSDVHMLGLVSCPKCGASNKRDERYCTVCGARIEVKELAMEAGKGKGGFLSRFFGKRS